MREFEGGPCVIVESANQPVVERKRNSYLSQDRLHCLKVHAASFIQKLADARQLVDNWLVLTHLTIEHTQRICYSAPLAVDAHLLLDGLKCLTQRFVDPRAVARASHRIQLQVPIGDAKPVQQGGQHLKDFSIACRRLAAGWRRPDDFGSDLIKLPITALLWAFAPELRANVIKLIEP